MKSVSESLVLSDYCKEIVAINEEKARVLFEQGFERWRVSDATSFANRPANAL